jgi:flagellar basal body-associated protein FliL
MKMNKQVIITLFLISAIILMANIVSALTILTREEFAAATTMKDTTIEYTSYREIVVNEPGVIYLIKITNTGKDNKTYEITPDASVIRNIGAYRLDPSDTTKLQSGEQETFYLYLAVEKPVSERTAIPVKIKSGSTDTTIELVARPVGPFMPEKQKTTGAITQAFKIVLSILLVIIIILALIFGFRRIRKKEREDEGEEEEKPEFSEDVETYY